MPLRPELTLRLPNSPGALADVCRLLASERVNILALSLDTAGHVRLVVDNHVRAAGVLGDAHHQVTQRDVLVSTLANAPGAAAMILKSLGAAGVNVDYAYASTGAEGATTLLVLGVTDPQRAALAGGI